MEPGSLTFRLARTLTAGAFAALRWLLVLAVVVVLGLPLMRIAAEWYVRGSVEAAPPPTSASPASMRALTVGNASPSEVAAVRSAAAGLRYRIDPHSLSVMLMDGDALGLGAQGEYLPYLGVIRLQRTLVDVGGMPLSWALAHEIGHSVDERNMTDAARTRFRAMRHIPSSLTWQAPSSPWNQRPDEDFAEVFAALAVPEAITPPATAYGRVANPAAFESLLRSVGVTFGRPPPPTSWRDVVARELAFLRSAVSEPRASRGLLVLLALYIALGAVPAMIDAWRRSGSDEGVPRDRPLDRRASRVLNIPRLVPHRSRSKYVTHTSGDHGGGR